MLSFFGGLLNFFDIYFAIANFSAGFETFFTFFAGFLVGESLSVSKSAKFMVPLRPEPNADP